jgi:hypothetical protein
VAVEAGSRLDVKVPEEEEQIVGGGTLVGVATPGSERREMALKLINPFLLKHLQLVRTTQNGKGRVPTLIRRTFGSLSSILPDLLRGALMKVKIQILQLSMVVMLVLRLLHVKIVGCITMLLRIAVE